MLKNEDKKFFVADLFSRIADKYDILNDLMTFSLHREWKKWLIKEASQNLANNSKILDLCTGTGDIALLWTNDSRVSEIIAVDSSKEMLQIANQKNIKYNTKKIKFYEADALELPFENESFDAITVGFGLRNLSDLDKGLEEIKRVLKPNGFIASLDLGHPRIPIIKNLYKNFFLPLIPWLGLKCANDKNAYQYLVDSLNTWPEQELLAQMFWRKDFQKAYFIDIMFGATAIVVAQK